MKNHFAKKVGAVILSAALAVSMAACGPDAETPSADPSGNPSSVPSIVPSNEPTAFSEYTIRFDLNTTSDPSDDELYVYEAAGYDENWQPVTEQKDAVFTVPAGDDAYLDVTIPDPVREGYYFAGWQTRPNVTDSDLVNGVSPYLWMLGQKASALGQVQIANSPAAEIEARQLNNETMLLKDLENLDENGNGTLYARWVEIKQISNEEQLRGMANDLYGAYELVADIKLTQPWTPVGCYFQNYEYYETSWWNFAFRGTLLGNGHTISGLQINGAVIDSDSYRTDATAMVWHNDGMTCDGTAAMFGATAGATIQDVTLVDSVINVSGDYAFDGEYCYVATISAFDMESTLTNVSIKNVSIKVETTEGSAVYRDSLYATVGGLVAGGWNDVATNCSISGSIELNTENTKSHGGYVFLGGLIGECYATMTGCNVSDLSIKLNSVDVSKAAEDSSLQVSVGGIGGSNTSSTGNTVDADIAVNVSKPVGVSSINVGGYTGSQLYLAAIGNTVNARITTNCTLDETAGELNVGSVGGRIDVYYMLQILQYAPMAQAGATGNTADVTWNGQALETLIADVPMINGEVVPWITNGDFEISEGNVAPSNIEAIIETYGSYVPQSSMMPGIVYITVY